MPVIKGLEWTFDTVASTYEKLRPGYVEELYGAIFDYIPVGENSNVVEVGSGGGQATAPMLKTGCRLTVCPLFLYHIYKNLTGSIKLIFYFVLSFSLSDSLYIIER